MGKELSEMTLEELWELFPISLVARDDRWKDRKSRQKEQSPHGRQSEQEASEEYFSLEEQSPHGR